MFASLRAVCPPPPSLENLRRKYVDRTSEGQIELYDVFLLPSGSLPAGLSSPFLDNLREKGPVVLFANLQPHFHHCCRLPFLLFRMMRA
eukprot:UN2449